MRFGIGILLLAFCSSATFAANLVSDDFEGGSLSPTTWSANTHGQIVVDPLNATNHVLNFNGLQGAGDLFSVPVANISTFYLSFDYLYQSPAPFGGGFIGYNDPGETWLAGDCNGCYPSVTTALNGLAPDVWHHVQIQFGPVGVGPLVLKLEQFQGTVGNAYFDNVLLSDTAFAGIPEPSTVALLLTGAAALAIRRRKVAA